MQTHITVLTTEAVEGLAITQASTVVDATLGAGGHAALILTKLGKTGTFVGIDADPEAIKNGTKHLRGKARIELRVSNFKNIDSILNELQIDTVDAILADLGWRMEQMSGNGKGFSFLVNEPLIMTYGDPAHYTCTARDIIHDWSEQDITNVLRGYGEERYARRIAQKIVETRVRQPIETTFDLVEVIQRAVPSFYLHGKTHPATRTFQSLRIAVNDEFRVLEEFIAASIPRLSHGGRLAIISFHSLEDRIVKHTFRAYEQSGAGKIMTKKPIIAGNDELQRNPRSRSAKLRIFEKQ